MRGRLSPAWSKAYPKQNRLVRELSREVLRSALSTLTPTPLLGDSLARAGGAL